MLRRVTQEFKDALRARGIECFSGNGVNISDSAILEPPCSIKWMGISNEFSLGAFSYAVSGYFADVSIGRYTSIGEQVQAGRGNHAMTWVSTSPFFHGEKMLFDVGSQFKGSERYMNYVAPPRPHSQATIPRPIRIGDDVWIGHGAFISPGVTIGDGAIVGAMAVVTKDVPPYGVVVGNPGVLTRIRFPPKIVAQLLEIAWWRYAPWQLTEVDFTDVPKALEQMKFLTHSAIPYTPDLVCIRDLLPKS